MAVAQQHGVEDKVLLTVEVQLTQESQEGLAAVKAAALAFLSSLPSVRYMEAQLASAPGQHPLLDMHVQSMRVVDVGDKLPPGKLLLQWDVAWNVSYELAACRYEWVPHVSGSCSRALIPCPCLPCNPSPLALLPPLLLGACLPAGCRGPCR